MKDVTKSFKLAPKAVVKERPPKPAPAPPPVPADFEIRPIGTPYLQKKADGGQQVEQLYKVFRNGEPKLAYRVVVESKAQLEVDVAKALEQGRAQILAEEALIDAAKALVGA